jgi:4-amino-4-deoxy-L-arabinose transferase-like glycosyltransferase
MYFRFSLTVIAFSIRGAICDRKRTSDAAIAASLLCSFSPIVTPMATNATIASAMTTAATAMTCMLVIGLIVPAPRLQCQAAVSKD